MGGYKDITGGQDLVRALRITNRRTEDGLHAIRFERVKDGGTITQLWAREILDYWDRKSGWVLVDAGGKVVFGAGQSTKIGKGLFDCMYLYASHLEREEIFDHETWEEKEKQ